MGYVVKEVFATLQGEGFNTGRVSVFCRFAGCNLWTGREANRASAICRFCDTDFVGTDGVGGGHFPDAATLADHIAETWPAASGAARFVVCTGGEPLLQLDSALIDELHDRGFAIAIETNGTIAIPPLVDWVCMSPKAEADVVVTSGDELKLVYPQAGGEPERYAGLAFDHFFLQPMDGPERQANTRAAIDYCLHHPQWRLSVQTHKFLGIP
ncbi:MAG TPA: 7-carboxy-7-deazaguanine synthase [Acidimicrobiales bacterium]|jgi:7-carboxy-7-deazaguanine synthase (Cx14CxxC type)|nr:7-carboxy-7-deazaguanine synthase [Acidimicrobiales bacterium]